jgi:hypothetical protein
MYRNRRQVIVACSLPRQRHPTVPLPAAAYLHPTIRAPPVTSPRARTTTRGSRSLFLEPSRTLNVAVNRMLNTGFVGARLGVGVMGD